jgi:hypothetical protein
MCNSAMLPSLIPIFPLPNVVLFPSVFLPLHIFEPRYRRMVEDALAGDRIIGMVLLRRGWEADYEGRPAVYPLGCAGVLTHHERLEDGRFNIVLRGLHKFRILAEEGGQAYRLARVEALPEAPCGDLDALARSRQRLEALIAAESRPDGSFPSAMCDEELVHSLAQYAQLEAIEKQALLECDGLLPRCRSLVELLEMRRLAARGRWVSDGVH